LINAKTLQEMYDIEKLSSRQIASKHNCGKSTILDLMKRYGIKVRSKKETGKMIIHPVKYKIAKEELERLYINEKLSMKEIAEMFGTQSSNICTKIHNYNIKTRTLKEGNSLSIPRRSQNIAKAIKKYTKTDFQGNNLEKSYLIGFRLGDLHVKKNRYGETIYIRCKSTKKEQIKLIEKLFYQYGHIHVNGTYKTPGKNIICSVNLSFSFLLKKEDTIEDWILNNKENFIEFLAGYIDAEGHFGIDRKFGEFAISSYDKNIINSIYRRLIDFNIKTIEPRISKKEGHIDKRGVRHKKDLWTLKIRRKKELLGLINLLELYLKHEKRYKDMLNVKNNILRRNLK